MTTSDSSSKTEVKLSDPCQVPIKDPITGQRRICGHITKTLAHHVKTHKKVGGKKWTSKEYKTAFPTFSMGVPPAPSEKAKEKFIAAATNRIALIQSTDVKKEIESEAAGVPARDAIEAKTQARFNELWDEVNRDVASRQFALEAARCEVRLEDLNARYDRAFRTGEIKKMNDLLEQIAAIQTMLQKNMNFLDLSVKNRREKGQLGNDTVSQLVSNYAGTLRRMSPEAREIFANRCRESNAHYEQRLREKTLFDLTDSRGDETVQTEAMKTEEDYDAEILKYVKGIGL